MLLLSTSSLRWYWLHKIFMLAKKANYDGIDLDIEKFNFDTWDEEYLKNLVKEFDMPILSITAPEKWVDEKKVDKFVKMASTLGTQSITFSPPYITDKWVNWFTKYLLKVKRDTRISIAVQNVKLKFLLFVIPQHKSNSLIEIRKVTWDTALNMANIEKTAGMDILKANVILWNTIRNIYLSDKMWAKDGLLPGNAGGGTSYLPIESFLMKLRTNGYSGFISLKVRPTELGAGNDEKVLQNLEYLKTYYKKHFLAL